VLKVFKRVPHVILASSCANMLAKHSSVLLHGSLRAETPLQTEHSNKKNHIISAPQEILYNNAVHDPFN